ncbi:hypothetical protein F9802_18190 [Bacillus aerolatus]|uniref:DUF8052 domain-containing protein n=1 Tax=Bacillus aerolatus TaxID=2653354 RepID=A0A6I1FR18_9BACI|nr:hypothetical protein [Bacillus aerolatus]KAB7704222.1 hypothetical protein F9802_18190 [Bacillus aerolatus]
MSVYLFQLIEGSILKKSATGCRGMQQRAAVETFVHDLCNLYVPYFNVERNSRIGKTDLEFSAVYTRRDERYLITKKAKVWGVENQQVVFVSAPEQAVTITYVEQMIKDMQSSMKDYLHEHRDHMSTVFTGVIVTDQPISKKVIHLAERFRKVKFLRFGAHGWAELNIAILDLPEKRTYIHKKGRPFVEPLNTFLKGEKKE